MPADPQLPRITFTITQPTNAHPRLPHHVHKLIEEPAGDGRFYPPRKEWVGSYPSRELAQGAILHRQGVI